LQAFAPTETHFHMPIYEYKCPKCGVVEVMQGIKEATLKKCPNCKSKVERMISSSSFVLKGSGWYATDYAKKSSPASESSNASNGGSENGAAKPAADTSASKSDTSSEKTGSSSDTKSPPSTDKPATTAKPTKAAPTKSTD
jgi:putative FmdB family regulatory protein